MIYKGYEIREYEGAISIEYKGIKIATFKNGTIEEAKHHIDTQLKPVPTGDGVSGRKIHFDAEARQQMKTK